MKRDSRISIIEGVTVAPPAGAWIETKVNNIKIKLKKGVAPPAGAWIETN